MAKIKIKNFGPIKEGLASNDGFIEIKKVTVFIGNQGSGKSTIAKLISTLSWLEKALMKGEISEDNINSREQFIKHCDYQNISEYFRQDKTDEIIEYIGDTLHFILKDGKIAINKIEVKEFFLPKIMYVPSDRNLISAVRNVRNLKGLPGTLYTFSDEFLKAVERQSGEISLPINEVKYDYQKSTQTSSIIGKDYTIKLSNASSGFQSLVPLYIVSKHISESISKKENSLYYQSIVENSLEEEDRLRKEIEWVKTNKNLSDKIRRIYLETLSSKIDYSSFLNIVEEPEQNLYPSSQRHILNALLECNNIDTKNKLVLTTHSPYLINYITLSVKATTIYDEYYKKMNSTDQKVLNKIVPAKSLINSDELIIYELDEKTGTVTRLNDYNGIPSDDNKLNTELDEFNGLFSDLLEFQQKYSRK